MKKAFAILLAAVMMIGCFTACGPSEDSKKDPMDSTPDVSDVSTTSGHSISQKKTTTATSKNPSATGSKITSTTKGEGTQVTTTKKTGNDSASNTKSTAKSTTEKATSTTKRTTTSRLSFKEQLEKAILSYLTVSPKVKEMTAFNPDSNGKGSGNAWSNIKAITFDGALKNDQKTKVFAYIGFPEGASTSNKVPAIVLVHGGGGHAYAEWVKKWTDRGYAAIAMDMTGYYPSYTGKGIAGKESDSQEMWTYGLYGDFNENGYTSAPNNDGMGTSAQGHQNQWMYHSIVSTILAHNILREDDRVAANKIGIAGISWGGVTTALAIGYDTRYAFAVPIYGSAYLDESHAWLGPIFSQYKTQQVWSAANRLNKVNFPVMWLCWNADTCFSINSNSKSYDDTKAQGAVLSALNNMNHSHGCGWNPLESYVFADSIVKDRGALTKVVTEPSGRNVNFTISADSGASKVSAGIYYITDELSYSKVDDWRQTLMDQTWKYQAATVNGNTVTGTVPSNAKAYYVEIKTTMPNGEKYVVTTRFVDKI